MVNDPNDNEVQQAKLQQLKSCQTLIMIALIGAPVSLILGGIALSTAALVCAIVSFVRLRKIVTPSDMPGSIERTLYNQAIIALVISIVALTMNAVAIMYMFDAIMEAMETGDVSKLFDGAGDATQEDGSSSISIWDR